MFAIHVALALIAFYPTPVYPSDQKHLSIFSPQRRKVRKVIIFLALPLRGRQGQTTQPCGHFTYISMFMTS
jgi:hypothetical protein